MTPEQKQAAVDYVQGQHCSDDIETDADGDSADTEFSPGEDGCWVRGWLWAPAAAIPGYQP